jgi:hypothetical protein
LDSRFIPSSRIIEGTAPDLPKRHNHLMGEIYDVRSAVEHLHENKYLEVFDRTQRLDLAKKELIV